MTLKVAHNLPEGIYIVGPMVLANNHEGKILRSLFFV